MRTLIVAVALVAGCKAKSADKSGADAAKAITNVPKVTVATVLASDDNKPPYLFVVDGTGTDKVRLAFAASWADLDANKLSVTKKAGPLDPIDRYVREEFGMGMDPLHAIKSWDEYSESDIDLASLEDPQPSALDQDDPPPPEEEDKPDDGEEESGGTGTAITLEEGKMGKKDSDRAEGQYKMMKENEDPQLARQQAIEHARNAGILGGGAGEALPYMDRDKPHPKDDGTPTRVAEVAGAILVDGKFERLREMILIAPTAKATQLIEVIRVTDAAIAVSFNGKIRPLRLEFRSRYGIHTSPWIEARLSTKGIVIEAVPDVATEIAAGDPKLLAETLDKARKTRGTDADAPVDILVDADIDVQRVVDLVVALDAAGVRTIGIGSAPSIEEAARRGHRIPSTTLDTLYAQGDLDKALIRKVVKGAKSKITACYAKKLATDPTLAGTVAVQFFIKPDGLVATATAIGVDPDVSTCVAEVIKTLVFPKPNGGGGVQVSYPFTMRP